MNLIKFFCIVYTALLFANPDHANVPLSTLGDALDSFLARNDDTTEHLILASKQDVQNACKRSSWVTDSPRVWYKKVDRWYRAASVRRLVVSIAT
jgi:hypothetical protein